MPVSQRESRSVPPTNRLISAEEYGEHPEWGPGELIRGKVVQLSNPKQIHGVLMLEIGGRIREFIRGKNLGTAFCGDAGIVLERDPDTIRGPDVGFISRNRMPKAAQQKYFEIAPELCIEIVSPSDRWTEITEKVDMYIGKGVVLVWVIDPIARQAHVYRKGRETRLIEQTSALDGEDVLPGFSLPLEEIFSLMGE
jgi:Uma2 family endonuclease